MTCRKPLFALSLLAAALGCTPTDPLSVRVTEDLYPYDPVQGARVAVEDVHGDRLDAVTDADGVAVLDIAWRDGPIDVVAAHPDGLAPTKAWLGIDERADLELQVPHAPREMVRVSGDIAHRTPWASVYAVAHVPHGGTFQSFGDTYSLEVPKGEPFAILAVEVSFTKRLMEDGADRAFHHWTYVADAGCDQDLIRPIALGDDLEPDGSLVRWYLPADETSPLRADLRGVDLLVRDADHGQPLGWGTEVRADGDTAHADGWVQWAVLPETRAVRAEIRAYSHETSSTAWVDGVTPSVFAPPNLLDPPVLVDASVDAAALHVVPADAVAGVRYLAASGLELYTAQGPLGVADLGVIEPPDGADADVIDAWQTAVPFLARYGEDGALTHLAIGKPFAR
jgi:hypothetical protein